MEDASKNIIEGKNPVTEALLSDRSIENVLIAREMKDKGALVKIMALAKERGVSVKLAPKNALDSLSETKNHQGVLAVASEFRYAELEDLLKVAEQRGEPPFIVVLDHITDPHNLGAIIRTAEAMGAHGVVIPSRRAATVTPVAEKAAAGAASHIAIAKVTNIGACIETLKKRNLWAYCTQIDGKSVFSCDFSDGVAIVIGSEGDGVSKLVSEKCDFHVSIPMHGKTQSLNASVAAGIVICEAARRLKK